MSCTSTELRRPSPSTPRSMRLLASDARGVTVTPTVPLALEHFERALGQYQSYVGDPIATIDEALALDPRFVLGHVFRALVLVTFTERRFTERARVSLTSAEALLPHASSREAGLVSAARRLVDGDWDEACRVLDAVLIDHPRDALALQTAHLIDFYRGDALNLRNRIARVLPRWNQDLPGYSYVLGMYAFGLEECNQYAHAEAVARRALALEPRDAWAVHAGAHVYEMSGRVDEGIAWLESRERHWAPDNGFAFHNYWHLAVFLLDQERYAEALALYDRRLHESPPDSVLQLIDATALLFRLYLEGVEIGGRAAPLARNWASRLDVERGFYAFNDLHAMMAFTMAGCEAESARLIADLEWTAKNGSGSNLRMTTEVGLPLARALRAFGRQRYEDTIALLQPVRDIASRFGGSHAQRDVLTLTLIEAALRSGRTSLARHFVAERTIQRPGGQLGARLAARAERVDDEGAPTTAPERPLEDQRFDVRRIALPGRCELEYVERGEGPVVLLLHGLTDSWRSFQEVLRRCPPDLRFIALSQRGHGDSERPETGYLMDDFAADVVGFMDALGIDRATVVGHSMGSLVAQTLAAGHPSRVSRLALIGSATTFDSAGTRELASTLATLSEIPRELAHEFQTGTLRLPIPDELLTTMVDESMKVPARVWRDALAGVLGHDGLARLGSMKVPTLVLWGAHDAYCPREEQERLRHAIRTCRVTIYEDLAHAPHWEDPESVVRDLVSFVRGS